MRPATRIALAMAAAAVGVVVFRTWFGEEGPSAPTEERGASEASAAKDEAHAIESAADSHGDDSVAAERTSDVAPVPKRPPRDLPVTWVEGTFTLIEEAPLPPPPWPNDRPPVLPDVVVDPARLDGSFLPMLIDGPDDEEAPDDPTLVPISDPRRVRVADGKFRFDAHGATAMLVTGLELDHRLAAADRGVEISADAPAAVRAHWIPDVLLHVLDAKTKAELNDVAVVARPWSSQVEEGRVQPADVLAGPRASPLHVSWKQGAGYVLDAGLLWIGAPGHAWRPRDLDLAQGGTKSVELDAGAALVVVVKGDDAERPLERRPRLKLRDVGGRTAAAADVRDEKEAKLRSYYGDEPRPETSPDWLVFDVVAADEPMGFDGLPPGEFVASLEVGDGSAPPLVLSSATVKLVAGETLRLELALDPKSIAMPVPVAGTLYVPPSWGRWMHDLDLHFEPEGLRGGTKADRCVAAMNDMEAVPGKTGWYRWRVGPILPATYRIEVPRARFETHIAVGNTGRNDVAIALPEAALLVVKIVDDASKEPVALEYLEWNPVDDDRFVFNGRELLHWDREEQALVGATAFRTGNFGGGTVAYELLGDPTQPAATHTVRTGRNDIVLIAHRRCGVNLRVDRSVADRVGAQALLRWTRLATGESDEFWWYSNLIRYLRPNGKGPPVDLDVAADADHARTLGRNCFSLPAPGRYRLSFPEVPSIAPFEVDVPEGEFVKYVVGGQ
jgi:hypothetical protein